MLCDQHKWHFQRAWSCMTVDHCWRGWNSTTRDDRERNTQRQRWVRRKGGMEWRESKLGAGWELCWRVMRCCPMWETCTGSYASDSSHFGTAACSSWERGRIAVLVSSLCLLICLIDVLKLCVLHASYKHFFGFPTLPDSCGILLWAEFRGKSVVCILILACIEILTVEFLCPSFPQWPW